MGKIQPKKPKYAIIKAPEHIPLTPTEKKTMQDELEVCRKQIARDKELYKKNPKDDHRKFTALGHGNLLEYFLLKKGVIRVSLNSITTVIIDLEGFNKWRYHYKKYEEALTKSEYAKQLSIKHLTHEK